MTELSNGEKALKTKVGLLASKTWTAQKDLAKTDAEISKGLSIVERQFMPLELKIEKLSGYLVNMKLSVSFDEQEKTEGMIKKIINDLEKLRRKNATEAGETDQNAKALNELQNAMDSARQAADQQLDINNATKKQGGLNVPEPETMKDLSKKQSDVKNQMEDTAKQLKNNSRTSDQGKQMDETIRNMENSRSRLNQNDAGKNTQQLQENLLKQMDNMLKEMKQQSDQMAKEGQGKGEGQGESQGKGEGQGEGQGKGEGQGEGQGKGEGQGQGEGEGQGKGQPGQGQGKGGQGAGTGPSDMAGERKDVNLESTSWGDLPPEVQKSMIDSMKDSIPVEYMDIIKGYYKKLAEEGDSK